MPPDWTTRVTYYKSPESDKPYNLEISAESHLGNSDIRLRAETLEEAIKWAKRLSPVYLVLTEQAPIITLHNSPAGMPLDKREEAALLKALRGE